ncbi:HAD family hydrolase [Veronia nyctiphanis]|uniref:HAD family hydrolase n=1 Tax=Veronia nyctiphanis TaxID=1278244 RepID=A0A4V1LSM5_9GAMM|nr:HAD family phosphatase [Veronia nyctiphanis]RXJ72218.1 HAD family hydrolase [Veronia nyctiphanis]
MNYQRSSSKTHHYSALLWDNDGVLVDTERLHFQSTSDVFEQAGIKLTLQQYVDYFLKQSKGTSKFAAAHGLSVAEIADIKEARDTRYSQLLEKEPIVIDGVRETLNELRPNFTMGIVTSSRRHHLEAMHERTGLLEFFDFIVSREDYTNSKPAPDPYLAAITRSGSPANNCLAIEDALRGLIAAQAANLDCWIIPTELTQAIPFSGEKRRLNTISDAANLLIR